MIPLSGLATTCYLVLGTHCFSSYVTRWYLWVCLRRKIFSSGFLPASLSLHDRPTSAVETHDKTDWTQRESELYVALSVTYIYFKYMQLIMNLSIGYLFTRHFKTFSALLAEKAASDDAVPSHAGGRQSAWRRESDWVRRKSWTTGRYYIQDCFQQYHTIRYIIRVECLSQKCILIDQNSTFKVVIWVNWPLSVTRTLSSLWEK